MLRPLRSLSCGLAFACVLASAAALLPATALAFDCEKSNNGCTISIHTSIFTGTPTVICNSPWHVIRVEVSVVCGQCEAVTRVYERCGGTQQQIQFTDCGKTHTITLPYDILWEDALYDCTGLVYTAS